MSKLVLNKYSLYKKDFSVLLSFLAWLIVGFIIIFIGINNVFASTYYMNYEYLQKYYDNYGSSVTAVTTTWNESLQSYVSDNIGTTANSYGAGLSISSPIPILENHTYTLSIYFENINNVALSSKNHIAISTGLSGAATNYANGNYYVNMVQSNVNSDTVLQFVFTAKGHGSFIFIPWTTTYNTTQSYVLTQITMEDLGSEGISQSDINNSLNNQTNQLNQSIQNSTDTIINNQNQNNEELKDTINENFNSCRESYNLFNPNTITRGKRMGLNGVPYTDESYFLSDYINVIPNKTYTVNYSMSVYTRIAFYDKDKNFISHNQTNSTFTIPENAYYLRLGQLLTELNNIQIQEGSVATEYEPYGEEICSNKIDETNDKLDDLNNNITNDNIDDNNISNAFNNFENFIDENATISSLITLPVTLFSSILNGLQSSCTPFNLGSLYGENLILPCINISSYLGSTLWTMIDVIISGFAIYFISKKFIKVFTNFSSMKEGDVIDD